MIFGIVFIGNVFAWTLTVNLVDKPFGDDEAWVEVRGPDGYRDSAWYDWSSIKTGPSTGKVALTMPDSAFPSGEPYEVCASSGDLRPYVMPNCSSEFHSSGNEVVTKSLR
jgi:hypothetical protein